LEDHPTLSPTHFCEQLELFWGHLLI
jgi:hypothetical protein